MGISLKIRAVSFWGGLKLAGLNADYLNVSPQQGILLFKSESDEWKETASRVLGILEELSGKDAKCYVAVSSGLKNRSQLAERCRETELLMEKPFLRSGQPYFHGGIRWECADDVQLDDNTLIKQIQQDVRTKDMLSLSEHVDRLFHNYRTERRIFPDLCEIRLFQPVEGFI